MLSDDTTRQARMLLAGNPHTPPEERLLEPTPRTVAWLNKWKAMTDRLVMAELRYEAADAAKTCRVKR